MIKYREIVEMPRRLYAVGDIHGCLDELEALLQYLKTEEKLTQDDGVLFIGDYIDRGPQSKEVVDALLAFRQEFPATIFLRGNHEDMLLSFLGFEGREGRAYLFNGGAELLTSYGVQLQGTDDDTRKALLEAISPEHASFYGSLENYIITPEHVFTHAGLNPLRDLHMQVEADLFWIREEFINNIHYFGRTVVFGHTPYEDVLFHLPFKIGIDTGLVYGNMLSCIEVIGEKIFQVERGKNKVKVGAYPKAK